MSETTVGFVVLGILLALFILCAVLFSFFVELLGKLLRRTPLAPFVTPRRARRIDGIFFDDE